MNEEFYRNENSHKCWILQNHKMANYINNKLLIFFSAALTHWNSMITKKSRSSETDNDDLDDNDDSNETDSDELDDSNEADKM